MKVVDLGGVSAFWEAAPLQPAHLTLVNLERQPTGGRSAFVQADACDPPDIGTFDLVISNSVLEHVGGYKRRRQFAQVVHSLAPSHWVQTPYRYFPVEPHWVFPGFQFLPPVLRLRVARMWPFGFMPNSSLESVLSVELIGKREMQHLFPDSEVSFEIWLGLPKSMIAIK